MLVSRWPTSPPVQDSAMDTVSRRSSSNRAHRDFQGVLVLSPAVGPEGLADLALHRDQRRLRRAAGGRARSELDPHVAVHRHAGDGDRALHAQPSAEALLGVRGRETGGVQRAQRPCSRRRRGAGARAAAGATPPARRGWSSRPGGPPPPRGGPRAPTRARPPRARAARPAAAARDGRAAAASPGRAGRSPPPSRPGACRSAPAARREPRERAADHLAARAARLREHHHQRGGLDRAPQAFLDRGLVFVHDLARGHRHAFGQEARATIIPAGSSAAPSCAAPTVTIQAPLMSASPGNPKRACAPSTSTSA